MSDKDLPQIFMQTLEASMVIYVAALSRICSSCFSISSDKTKYLVFTVIALSVDAIYEVK